LDRRKVQPFDDMALVARLGTEPRFAGTRMQALFIGQTYIDVTFLTDHFPTGDEKTVAQDYAVSFGGNAVSAAFCCAKLGVAPDLLTSLSDDWLSRTFLDMAAKYAISVHGRKVRESSLSFVMPNNGRRAILRCRDDHYLIRCRRSTSAAAARCTSTATRPTPPCTTPSSAASAGSSPRSTAAACAPTPTSCSGMSTSRSAPSGSASRWR
jgi:hypothetical protein